MSVTLYEASVPVFTRFLRALSRLIDKAAASGVPEARIVDARLAPDMHPFPRQVQIATDMAKSAMARLTGTEVPVWKDDEASFAELKARIDKALAFIGGFGPAALEGAEERRIDLTASGIPLTFDGKSYLLGFVMPNFYFHVTIAYALLRKEGVVIGKRDYFGVD